MRNVIFRAITRIQAEGFLSINSFVNNKTVLSSAIDEMTSFDRVDSFSNRKTYPIFYFEGIFLKIRDILVSIVSGVFLGSWHS